MKKDQHQDIFRRAVLAVCSMGCISFASPTFANIILPHSNENKTSIAATEKRETFNLSALLKAQSHSQVLMAKAKNGYSTKLTSLAARLSKYSKRNNLEMYSGIVVLDPLKADVGLALGIPKSMVISTLLLQAHIRPYASLVNSVNAFLINPVDLPNDEESYTQNPHALFLIKKGAERSACIIIPAPVNTVPNALTITNLTLQQQTDFENAHEGWHCLDNRYYVKTFPTDVYASFNPKNLQTLIGNQKALEAYANTHMAEAFADAAALGEWIRAGQPLSVCATIRNWRTQKAEDLTQATAPVLTGLEDSIIKMGIEKFRALTEAEARVFYYSITETYGLNAQRLEAKLRLDKNIPADENIFDATKFNDEEIERAAMRRTSDIKISAASGKERDLSRLITSFLANSGLSVQQVVAKKIIANKVASWDAMDVLEKRAISESHKVTPSSLAKAYADLEDELTTAQESGNQDADIYEAEAAKLKCTLSLIQLSSIFIQKITDRSS